MTKLTNSTAATLSIAIAVSISEMINKKRVVVGEVSIMTPSLEDMGIEGGEQGKPNKDGSLNYTSDLAQYIYTSILSRATVKAKNKLEDKGLVLKAGAVFDVTVAELVAPPSLGGNPEALKAIAAIKAEFRAHVDTLGLAAGVTSYLNKAMGSPSYLGEQSMAVKGKTEVRLAAFVATSPAALLNADGTESTYATKYLNNVIGACASEEIDLDEL